MSLIDQIKTQQLEARKNSSESTSLLTTLLSEAVNIGKNNGNRETTDAEVVAVVKKFIKNIDETVSALTTRNQDASKFLNEKAVLETFLPKQLTENELTEIAKTKNGMPDFMKFLKENHNGQYDGKLASTVAKTVFS